MKLKKNLLVSVIGPTASGKTAFGIMLAKKFETEILSVDSRQFYKELEIGTAKPHAKELNEVKHHFINSHSIAEYYSAGQFEREADMLLKQMFRHNPIVIAVGGSGLYLKALWEGMDDMPEVSIQIRDQLNRELEEKGLSPLLHELELNDPVYFREVDQSNHQRVIRALEVTRSTGQRFSSFRRGKPKSHGDYQHLRLGLQLEREALYERIDQRVDQMVERGLFEEAERLKDYRRHNAMQTVGYSEIFDFLDGKYDREEAIRLIKRNTRRYAKRQMTWFRKDLHVIWISPDDEELAVRLIKEQLDA